MICHLARIDVFPVKSLDGVSVPQARVLGSGALERDRTYALGDAQNGLINGKLNPTIHRLRSTFSEDGQLITLAIDGNEPAVTFHLQEQRSPLEAWLSNYFQQPVTLRENHDSGFPDDTQAAGPTVVSTATLEAVAAWHDLPVAEVRRRFRANLEVDGVPAFWEDQLFAPDSAAVRFAIGNVIFEGINPCQRCIVPTRDALTGSATAHFQKTFAQQRAATLPPWAPPQRFNHFYKLAVNTNIVGQAGQILRVGDGVSLV